MTMKSTPIPTAEKLQMLKSDAEAFRKGDNTALAESIDRAIALLERTQAILESRKPL